MWARGRIAAGSALARARAALGTPPVTAALLALVVAYRLAAAAWGASGGDDAAEAFATSWAFWLLAIAVCLDALAALWRAVPQASGRGARGPGRRGGLARVTLAAAWLLVGAALLASLSARDRFTLLVATGEEFQGGPGQVEGRARPRPLSPGPKPLVFTVTGVEPRLDAEGALAALDVRLAIAGRTASATLVRPVWLGGGRFLRAAGYGYAPRLELVDAAENVLESSFVKLDLLPPGTVDQARSGVLPHRVHVALPSGARLQGGAAGIRDLALQVDVLRGKQPIAGGLVHADEELRFEGLALRIPEVRYAAELVLVDDPGLVLLAAALVLAVAGAGLHLAARPAGGSAPPAGERGARG